MSSYKFEFFPSQVENFTEKSREQNQETNLAIGSSDTVKDIVHKPLIGANVSKSSPSHISVAVPSNISSSTSTTITQGSSSKTISAGKSHTEKKEENLSGENKRYAKLESLINESLSFDIEELRKLAWSGVSSKARAKAWKILCGYLPPPGTAAIR